MEILKNIQSYHQQIKNSKTYGDKLDILLKTILLHDVPAASLWFYHQHHIFLYAHQGKLDITDKNIPIDVGILAKVAHTKGFVLTEYTNEQLPGVTLKNQATKYLLAVPVIKENDKVQAAIVLLFERKPTSIDYLMQLIAIYVQGVYDNITLQLNRFINQANTTVKGICVCPGLAKGHIMIQTRDNIVTHGKPKQIVSPVQALAKVEKALAVTLKEIQAFKQTLNASQQTLIEIYEFYELMLNDDLLIRKIKQKVYAKLDPKQAIYQSFHELVNKLEHAANDYFQLRSNDIKNFALKIIKNLDVKAKQKLPEDVILVGDNLVLSDISSIPKHKLKGMVSFNDNTRTHFSLLAKALNVPAMIVKHPMPKLNLTQKQAILNSKEGVLSVDPADFLVYKTSNVPTKAQNPETKKPQINLKSIKLYQNLDNNIYRHYLSDGMGLYRSELYFLQQLSMPSQQDQIKHYKAIGKLFSDAPAVIRLLDFGADKQPEYFNITTANDFNDIGYKGLRVLLDFPDIFESQVKAILKAYKVYPNIQILIPMVGSVYDLIKAKDMIKKCFEDLQMQHDYDMPVIGAMLEVPSMYFSLDAILPIIDFISIGTNDLVPYLFAFDRNNPKINVEKYEYAPEIIQLLYQVISKCKQAKVRVGICGNMAADPSLTPLYIAMGVDYLSVDTLAVEPVIKTMEKFDSQDNSTALKLALKAKSYHELKSIIGD